MDIVDHTALLQRNLTFIEADPAGQSWFAAWTPAAPGGLLAAGPTDSVALVVPARRGTTTTTVSAHRIDMATAIDLLAPLRQRDPASPSARAWASVVRAALTFIADGRVLPWVSPQGFDTWRVDPLTPTHNALVAELAATLPAEAHATPVTSTSTSTSPARRGNRISDPTYAVRAVCDAVADRFLRTPAAHRVSDLSLYADPTPTKVIHLRPWVKDLAAAHCASSLLALRVHPPDDQDRGDQDRGDQENGDQENERNGLIPEGRWKVRFELVSRTDPTLVIDAADFWTAPAEVMARLGDQAEVILLAGLRTVAKLVPPFESVLDQVAPVQAELADDEIDLLLDALDELAEHRIDVRWPTELVAPSIERRVVAGAETASTSAPGGALATMLDLKSLLTVDWEFLLDGVALSVEELEVLGQAKRAVVPLRGKWVRLSPAERERLRARPPRLTMGDVLAASLGDGSLTLGDADADAGGIDGAGDEGAGSVEVVVTGALRELIDQLGSLTTGREEPEPFGLQAELRPYQRRGLAWMTDLVSLGLGGCLADDMGLGKTIQVLALHARRRHITDLEAAPTLVVCPTSLLANWEREAARFVPDVPVRVYHGPGRSLEGVKPDELVITSYGVVRGDVDELASIEFGMVVADEAQQAKNPRSSTARALRQLRSVSRIALTGTPVENRLSELWAIFDWAVPGLLGPLATFRRTTAVPIERDGDQAATTRLTGLLSPFLLRRRKSDPGIAPELPDKIERDVVVALSAEQATLYKATAAETLAEIEAAGSGGGPGGAAGQSMQRRGLVLALLTKLKQITDHPALFLGERNGGGELEEADEPDADRSGKLAALDDLLAATPDESTLIFTQYVGMGRILVAHLERSGHRVDMLHGGLTTKARQGLVDGFQAGELDVLVLSLKAGGTGLNLTAATNVVHFDRWWNPAVEDQATDRAYRIGQDRTVTVHRLITRGTVEERVADLLTQKRELADRVVGSGGEAWISELDDDQLAALVSLDGGEG